MNMNLLRTAQTSAKAISKQLLCFILVLAWFGAGPVRAQEESNAWFGQSLPNPARGANTAPSRLERIQIPELSLKVSNADTSDNSLDGERIAQTMNDIIAISQQSKSSGDPLWGRIGGTQWELMTAEYLANKFRQSGLQEVRIERMPRNPQWWPTEWEVKLLADPQYGMGSNDIILHTAFPAAPSPSTPGEGFEAELIYVGAGTPADLLGRDVRGKIAVYHAIFKNGAYSYTGRGLANRLIQAGALGAIAVHEIEENIQFFNRFAGSADAPGFTVSGNDGVFLEDMIARTATAKPLRARLSLSTGPRDGLTTQNVYGMIPGQTDEYIILTAHTDAYFDGAYDNATGLATLVALAEYYSRPGAPTPRRNLLFIGTGGHHSGRPGTPYTNTELQSVGTAYIVDHHQDLLDKTVLVLNIEHTALSSVVTGIGGIIRTNAESPRHMAVSNRSPYLLKIFTEALDRYGIVVPTLTNHFPGGDASNLLRGGVPIVNLISAGFWYHSSGDTAENIPAQGLERAARMWAYFLGQIDAASRVDINP